jgi:hypothetical protein
VAKGFIDTCLKTLARTGKDPASANLILEYAYEILSRPRDAAVLVRRIAEAPSEHEEAAQRLFEVVLDQARMARESHAPEGAVIFDTVEATLKELVEADRLDPEVRLQLAQIYARIGLDPRPRSYSS